MAIPISPETLLEISDALDKIMCDGAEEARRMQAIAELTRRDLSSHVAALLVKNSNARDHVLAVCAGGDAALATHLRERCAQHRNKPCFLSLFQGSATVEASRLSVTGWDLLAPEVARHYGIDAVLASPLSGDGHTLGLLCHFTNASAPFDSNTHQLLAFLAARVQTLIMQDRRFTQVARYQRLNRVTLDLIATRDADSLLKYMLEEGLQLVNAERGWVSRLDFRTGELRIDHPIGNPQNRRTLRPGRGITWHALKTKAPVLVDDVTAPEWRGIYEPYWPDTRSELAVPLFIDAAEVRQRCELNSDSKLIGVLNVESPLIRAFSEMDKELLHSLARHAAVLIDGLDLDRRLAELTDAQQEMTSTKGWDKILELMGATITDVIGFDYVNISLVTSDMKRIKTEYVLGVADNQRDEFKRIADHPLGGADIQASLVTRAAHRSAG